MMLVLAVLLPLGAQTVSAQFTILPQAKINKTVDDCNAYLKSFNEDKIDGLLKDIKQRDEIMGCAIMTGRISLNMIPYFISYFANFLLSLIGLICVLFIVIGGYYYIYGGLSQNKEKGKKTIYHALLGMSVAILSWVFINVIIAAVTS